MKRALKIAAAILRGILVAACVLIAVYDIYIIIAKYAMGNGMPTVFGYAGTVVLTGSMDDDSGDDDIEAGDLVIIHAEESYAIGDVVTFYDPARNEYVTHRVIDYDQSSGIYAIRGDAGENPVTDYVPAGNIVGKVVLVIGGVGYFTDFISTPAGLFVVIAAGVLIWIIYDIVWTLIERRKDEDKKD